MAKNHLPPERLVFGLPFSDISILSGGFPGPRGRAGKRR